MKLFSIHNLLLLVAFKFVGATPAPVATRQKDNAFFVATWGEAGLQRYRFNTNVQDMNRFVHAFQNCGGITRNWQAWREHGVGFFDVSEVVGPVGDSVIACGIKAVTGQAPW